MRFHVALAMLCVALPGAAQQLTPAQMNAKAKAQNVPEIPFDSAPNFLKLPPNLYLGEGIGVATNSKGHVFVYTRSQETRLFEFDQRGVFVREIGGGFTDSCSRTRSAWIKTTTSGLSTKAPTWSLNSIRRVRW